MILVIYNAFHRISKHSNETASATKDDEEMNISQEILVLDFGDEKSDFLRSGETEFGKGKIKNFSKPNV